MEISKLRELQSHFETNRASTPEAQQLYKQCDELSLQFQQKFTPDKLLSMTLEDYVVGIEGRKDTFCYWIQYKTRKVGEIFVGKPALAFGVYYSKGDTAFRIPDGGKSRVVSNDEAVKQMEKIRSGIVELLSFAEKKAFADMIRVSKQIPIDYQVMAKILTLYFPDKYVNVFSSPHINQFLGALGRLDSKTEELSIFERRELLLKFKEEDAVMKNWGNKKYSDFLYHEIFKEEPKEAAYFILRTGGGEYTDQQEVKYNFKEGIPGYKQLIAAAGNAEFVYLESGHFYGKGKIGEIKSYEKEGTKYFDAQVVKFEKMEPISLEDVGKLSITPTQAGIMKISEKDYKIITESRPTSTSLYTIDDFSAETGFEKTTIERWKKLLLRKKQIIFQGPPGTGKTFVAERLAKLVSQTTGLVETVQFHPDYSYEDFIQGYFPEPGNTVLQFSMKKGRFLDFCERAKTKPIDTPCVMIIDEINRAKLARVFGELMYLLEYRDKEIPLAAGGKPYRIPENVHLIGTMNTADRSIALVDHALRRRFSFIRLQPEYNILTSYLKKYNLPADSLVAVLRQVNRAINDLNYEVGISFFMKDQAQLKQWLPDIWKTEIEPYLEEYFYDQKGKVESFRWEKLAENSLKEWTM